MKWKDISIAPKDGTEILVTNEDDKIERVFYNKALLGDDKWQGTYYDGFGYCHYNKPPTHFIFLSELINNNS